MKFLFTLLAVCPRRFQMKKIASLLLILCFSTVHAQTAKELGQAVQAKKDANKKNRAFKISVDRIRQCYGDEVADDMKEFVMDTVPDRSSYNRKTDKYERTLQETRYIKGDTYFCSLTDYHSFTSKVIYRMFEMRESKNKEISCIDECYKL
jgi:hypothetical protein